MDECEATDARPRCPSTQGNVPSRCRSVVTAGGGGWRPAGDLQAEADAGVSREALHVRHPPEHDRDAAVVGVELMGALRARLGGRARARRRSRARHWRRWSGRRQRRLRSGRSQSSRATDTTSVRTPWTASGWTKATCRPKSPRRGTGSISSAPAAASSASADADVLDLVRDVVHPRAPLGEEPADRRVLAERGEQLDRLAPTSTEAASTPWSGTASRCSSAPPSRPCTSPTRLLEIGDRDADVVDAARVHAADATSRPVERAGQDGVDEPVLDGLGRRHEPVAVDVLHHLLDVAARMAGDDLRHLAGRRRNLARRDLDVGRRAAEAGAALVDHQLRVRQREPLPGAPPAMIIAAADIPIPKQIVRDVGLHVLHGVVDRHPRIRRAARRVDVQRDVPLGISASSRSSWATIRFAISSSTSRPRKTIGRAAAASRCRTRARRARRTRSRSGSLAQRPPLANVQPFGCPIIRNLEVARGGHARDRARRRPGGGLGGADRRGAAGGVVRERGRARPDARRRGVFRWDNGEAREAVVESIEEGERIVLRFDDDGVVDSGWWRPTAAPRAGTRDRAILVDRARVARAVRMRDR